MTSLVHDLRYALRQLLRTPSFTAAAVVTLALGIGINTAFFSIVNAVVYRPMRSLQLEDVYQPSWNRRGQGFLPQAHYRMLEANLPDMVDAVDGQRSEYREVIAHIPGRAERVQMLAVSGAHAHVFNLQPQAGRFITAADDREKAPSVVISDRLWREWFGGEREIVERANMRIDGQVYQIVGVAPPGYRGAAGFGLVSVDLWIPLSRMESRMGPWTTMETFIRLKPGADPAAAAAAVHAAVQDADKDVGRGLRVGPASLSLQKATNGHPLRILGLILLGLSSLVLLAACANLANMLYVRGVHRRAEMAVRQALGASSARIFRLLVAEAAMIGAASILIGLGLALIATRQFNAAFPLFRDRMARVTIDLSPDYYVFAYALAAGAGAALLVGAITAWRASRVPPLRGMAVGDAATSVTRSTRQTRLALVAVQVCIAVVLLMAAGMFYQQTRGLFDGTVRFDTRPLATTRIDLSRHGYNVHTGQAFLRRLNAEVAALPGMERAVVADGLPGGMYMGGSGMTFAAERTDLPFTRYIKQTNPRADGRLVATYPGFLEALGLRVSRGRTLQHADREGADLVVTISEEMAAALWPGGDALGKRLMFGNEGHWRTVVGIFENPSEPLPVSFARRQFDPARLVLTPFEQKYPEALEMTRAQAEKQAKGKGEDPAAVLARNRAAREAERAPREMLIIVRAADARGRLDAVRQQVAALDPDVAVFDSATVDESILAEMAPRRAGRLVLGALGIAALTIATLGIYSVISFLVARRTREFGIRMALGAQRRQVVKMVIDDAVHLLLVGLLAGVFLSSVGERLLGVRAGGLPNEILTWAVVLSGILAIGLVAAFIPARRAAGIDPNVALRDL